MTKPTTIDFVKNIFATHDNKRERAELPNPTIVGYIFAALFVIAVIFITL